MTDDEKIGQVIKGLIQRSGMKQVDVADKAGIDPGNLTRIIKGKQSAPTARLRAIGRVLGVEPWEIWRMADQGVEPEREDDPRKAALHALIDALDPSQIDTAFHRWFAPKQEQPPQHTHARRKEDRAPQKKAS